MIRKCPEAIEAFSLDSMYGGDSERIVSWYT